MIRLLCLFGLHRRSVGRIDHQAKIATSICRRCGVPMYLDKQERWRTGKP